MRVQGRRQWWYHCKGTELSAKKDRKRVVQRAVLPIGHFFVSRVRIRADVIALGFIYGFAVVFNRSVYSSSILPFLRSVSGFDGLKKGFGFFMLAGG